jgi:SNF2 family DNA or RNA helicase
MAPALMGELPKGFNGRLFPYQLDGFRWLSFMVHNGLGAIIADEMGLGKTVQVICILLDASQADKKPNLVIAPNTLLENWRRELLRFAPSLRVAVHSGPRRSGLPRELSSNNVLLCSYDTAVADAGLFRNIAWNLMVVDEAQGIKNYQTRRATQLKTFPRVCSVAMTGTPIENRLQDLWSITDFVLPTLLGSASDFEQRYPDSIEAASSLEPIVSPLLLRRTVAAVATDLPERIDIPQPLELDSESAAAYEAIRVSATSNSGTGVGLAALQKLRMFCTHPWLTDTFKMIPNATQCSVKLQRLMEILEEVVASEGKAIIFTSYTESIDLLCREIEMRLGVYTDSIDGRVAVANRQGKVDKFSSVTGAAVLVLNPKAAGVGLNITAANHVIHFNLEWNPAVEDQASARAHRRGQTRIVTVHRLYYANTVEEVIDNRMQRKRELSDAAIVGTTGQTTDVDDIMQALRISPVEN